MTDPGDEDGGFQQLQLDPPAHFVVSPPPTSHEGIAGDVETQVLGASRGVDRIQARVPLFGYVYATFKKYSDDEGSRLAALLAYYSFLSLFPLAVAGFAVLNTILGDNPEVVLDLVDEIVPEDYEQQVIDAYQSLPSGGAALAFALIGLLLSGTAGVFSLYAMVNQVYCVPYRFRFGFGPRYARVLLLVVLMGVGVLVVAVGSAIVVNATGVAVLERLAGFLLVWLVAAGLLYSSVNILTRRPLDFREVAPGAALGALAMTVIIGLGSALVGYFVASSSAVYGVFGTVVGIFSVLFLVSNAVVFSFELSAVWAWQLWPRGVDINLLFPADQRAYALLALMDERMPSQRNGIAFDATGHDDPRRPDLRSLMRRAPGMPRSPYDAAPAVEQPVPSDTEDS